MLHEACRGKWSVALAKKKQKQKTQQRYLPLSEGGEQNHCFVSQAEYSIVITESCPYLQFFSGITQICCLTITDKHCCAGYCAGQVYAR